MRKIKYRSIRGLAVGQPFTLYQDIDSVTDDGGSFNKVIVNHKEGLICRNMCYHLKQRVTVKEAIKHISKKLNMYLELNYYLSGLVIVSAFSEKSNIMQLLLCLNKRRDLQPLFPNAARIIDAFLYERYTLFVKCKEYFVERIQDVHAA